MFPMIPAFRDSFESQLDAIPLYPFGLLPDSMLPFSTRESCKEAFRWNSDCPSEGSLTNVASLTDVGEN